MSNERFPNFSHSAERAEQAMYTNLEKSQQRSEFAAKLGELQLRYESEYFPREEETWQIFGELFKPDSMQVISYSLGGREYRRNVGDQWYVTTAQDDTPVAVELKCTAPYNDNYRKPPSGLFAKMRSANRAKETVKSRRDTSMSFYNILPESTGSDRERTAIDGNYLVPIVDTPISMERPNLFESFAESLAAEFITVFAYDEARAKEPRTRKFGRRNIIESIRCAEIRRDPMKWFFEETSDDIKNTVLGRVTGRLQLMNDELDRILNAQELIKGASPEPRGFVS